MMENDWKVDCSDDESYGLTYSELVRLRIVVLFLGTNVFVFSANNGCLTLKRLFS